MHKKHTVLFYCETIEVCDMSSFWLVKHVCNYLAVVCRHKLPKSDKTLQIWTIEVYGMPYLVSKVNWCARACVVRTKGRKIRACLRGETKGHLKVTVPVKL